MSQGEILLFAEENSFVKQYTKVQVSQPNMIKVPQSTKVREEIIQEPELQLPKPAWIDIVDKMMAPIVPEEAYQDRWINIVELLDIDVSTFQFYGQ